MEDAVPQTDALAYSEHFIVTNFFATFKAHRKRYFASPHQKETKG
jgi:hypothetical protein